MRDGKNKKEDIILRETDGHPFAIKNFIHIPTEHSSTHFCSHFRVWKGLQPSLQHVWRARQPGLRGEAELCQSCGGHSRAAGRSSGATCSFPAARGQLLPAAGLCWIRDCCFTSRQEEMSQRGLLSPHCCGAARIPHTAGSWWAPAADSAYPSALGSQGMPIRQCHVLLVSHAGHFAFCQFSNTWKAHPEVLNNIKVMVGSGGKKDGSALGKGPFYSASAADSLCPHLPEILPAPSLYAHPIRPLPHAHLSNLAY